MVFENVCRLCRLTTNDSSDFVPLFVHNLNDKLRLSMSINVEENDNLPKNICNLCKTMIEQASFFKKRCNETNIYFKGYLRKRMLENKSSNESHFGALSPARIKPMKPIAVASTSSDKRMLPYQNNANNLVSEVKPDVVRHYSRKPKETTAIASPVIHAKKLMPLPDTPRPLRSIKQEPKSFMEMVNDDWDDEKETLENEQKPEDTLILNHSTSRNKSQLQLKHEFYDEPSSEEEPHQIKLEPFDDDTAESYYDTRDSDQAIRSSNQKLIGEEFLVEDHCKLLTVYKGGNNTKRTRSETPTKSITYTKEKTIYFCGQCSTQFQTELSMLQHECGNLRFMCHICNEIFTNNFVLVKHIAEHNAKKQNQEHEEDPDTEEVSNENVYSGNFIRMQSTLKRQKTMYFKDE